MHHACEYMKSKIIDEMNWISYNFKSFWINFNLKLSVLILLNTTVSFVPLRSLLMQQSWNDWSIDSVILFQIAVTSGFWFWYF